ncbi:ABC transporter permease [Blattabacterium cuenoti]|uniref:ABC transporter permease n=1 Tax=Blattabacterium cuenoti TaxID=1653831 RepID=UPI00163BD9FB|nr:FtsX-like permease family protein [Blattabacterium cuenoti]
MNFEWFFSKKTIWKDCSKNKILRTIVIITQTTISFGIIIIILTFSIGFGFKKIIKNKFLNIRGQIIVENKNSFFYKKNQKFYLKKYFDYNFIKQIHGIIENNIIIGNNNTIGRYIYKGLYQDYNPIFFQYFLIKGNFYNKKKNYNYNNNVILSKKISQSLKLDIGSNIKIDFIFFKKKGIPVILSKNFIVSGLYETGIPEFDNLYIIGNIKDIQKIYGYKQDLFKKFEIFLYSFHKKNIEKKILKKVSNNFLIQNIYDHNNYDILEWINIFDINIIVISFIVFISLVINMIVFILILLLERIRTIGILKTLGARNKVIHKIFIFYILQIFIPSLIIGNSIGITLLILQKKFHLISLNKIQYFVEYVPIDINIIHIFIINASIILICFVTIFFPIFFIINKISTIKVIEFE